MGQLIDLRKYNIRTEEDAMEFLELFVAKAPQLVKFIKDQKFKRVSLENRLTHAQSSRALPDAGFVIDDDSSVLDRLTGAGQKPDPAASRLAQLRAAQASEAEVIEEIVDDVQKPLQANEIPPAPVAPGDIGRLNIPHINQKEVEFTPEEVAQVAGSKSERPVDNDIQQEDTAPLATTFYEVTSDDIVYNQFQVEADTFTHIVSPGDENRYLKNNHYIDIQEYFSAEREYFNPQGSEAEVNDELTSKEKAALGLPTEEDKTPIGMKIAKKTNGKLGSAKKK